MKRLFLFQILMCAFVVGCAETDSEDPYVDDADVDSYEDSYEDESGIPDGYTPIYTAEEMDNVRNDLSGYYILMDDIDLASYAEEFEEPYSWMPIGDEIDGFTGIFEGNGKTISGLVVDSTGYRQGLFGCVSGGSVLNLMLYSPQVSGYCYVGAICGYMTSSSSISGCVVTNGSVSGDDDSSYVGGVIGYAYSSTLTDCYNMSYMESDSVGGSYVEGGSDVGGVIGGAYYSDVIGCYNIGFVEGDSNVGGVVGRVYYSDVVDSYNIGSVEGSIDVGGVVGDSSVDSTITACYNMGIVDGRSYVGGVVGYSSATSTTACYNTGSLSGSSFALGGVVGYNYISSMTACYNAGSLSSSGSYIGDVTGYSSSSSTIVACYYVDPEESDENSGVGVNSGTGEATAVTVTELNGYVGTMNTEANTALETSDVVYYTAGTAADTYLPSLMEEVIAYE